MPTPYDLATPPEPMRILRSALPYLGFVMQRQLSLALKLMEIQTMMQKPPQPEPDLTLVRSADDPKTAPVDPLQNRLQMLKTIRTACNPEHAAYVDTLMQTFRMQSMIQMMPSVASAGGPATDEAAPVIPFLRSQSPAASPEKTADSPPTDSSSLNDTLRSMLNPGQQAMFQAFTGMMKSQDEVREVSHG